MSQFPLRTLPSAALVGLLSVALAACGSDPAPLAYSVGGSVTGLSTGTHVVLKNGAETLDVPANGSFAFTQKVPEGGAWSVTVQEQPAGHTCTVQGGSGTIHGSDVTSVGVVCSTFSYSVGGSVTGLSAGSHVVLSNGAETLDVAANGPFAFTQQVAHGAAWSVTVQTQPAGHTCTVEGGSGTVQDANVTSVSVVCTPRTFAVRGTVTGLPETQSVVLKDNDGDELTVTADGSFSFATPVVFGGDYAVTAVATYPTVCTVAHGSGTVGAQDVTDVAVTCGIATFTVGGNVVGMVGDTQLELQLDGADVVSVAAPGGSFTFNLPVPDLGTYAVTIKTQPRGQTCTVRNGAVTLDHADFTHVEIACSPEAFQVRGMLTGLKAGQTVVLKNKGGDDLTVSANGLFTFATKVAFADTYDVTQHAVYPLGCTLTNGTGTMPSQAVTNVSVSCSTTTYTVGGQLSGLLSGATVNVKNNGEGLPGTTNGPFTFPTPVADLGAYNVLVPSQPPGHTCTVARGTGNLAGHDVTDVAVTCAVNTYTVGGTVVGLTSGQSLKLRNNDNAADELTVTSGGPFTFTTKVTFKNLYAVTVAATYPLECIVPNGAGTMAASNVTGVNVFCSTKKYTVGGTVTGLAAGTTLELRNNGGNDLAVAANGAFTFSQPMADLSGYAVSIQSQPEGQTCTVDRAAGSLDHGNVADVAVTCTPKAFAVRGTVTGLVGGSVVLKNNGGDAVTLTNDGTFAFNAPVGYGAAYGVTAETSSPWVCSVSNGSGTMGTRDVENVAVVCGTTAFTLGGTVTGLAAGTTLTLQNNGDALLTVTADGAFTFTRSVAQLGGYDVTVKTNPTGQRCLVQGGNGTVNGGPITGVAITCADLHGLHVDVAGLTGTLELRNGPDALTVSAAGDHAFARGLLAGEAYAVEVARHPVGQTCEVASGSGTMDSADVTLTVTCSPNLMVVRLGVGGSVAIGPTAAAVQVEEYRPTGGAPVRTFPLPWLGRDRLTLMGSIGLNEGLLARSADGRFLTFAGYDADMGTSPRTASASTTARVVGQLDVHGRFTIPVRINDGYNTTSIRAAITDDGSRYWLSGEGSTVNTTGGIRFVDGSSPTSSVQVSSTVYASSGLGFVDGALVFATSTGSYSLGYFPNNPLPTVGGAEAGGLPGFVLPTGQSATAGAFATLDTNGDLVPDVAYVAAPSAGFRSTPNTLNLQKWTFDGATWTQVAGFVPRVPDSTGAPAMLPVDGVTAVKTPAGVRVYVTMALTASSTSNHLATFLDDGTTLNPVPTLLVSSPQNTLFRSVVLSPRP
ncbi:hypothetical protein [Pyxidicoccus sp. MSG2]|uniref:hypothetical protein n=1 Tax=Pyxidicoccus sp. MSG2 TaxID=2996790 RepID=UPI00226F52DB|nr:hypothetical protein [Pyxidicoccus sp. MSG2]MCY1022816.1 hypothetical protein [Pyxidicoccus sp. MSG2]